MTESLTHLTVTTYAHRPDKGLKLLKIISRNFDGVLLNRDRVKCIPELFKNLRQNIMCFHNFQGYVETTKGIKVFMSKILFEREKKATFQSIY